MIVSCPNCSAKVEWKPDAKWRPFCSERCRLIDLGAWADEQYSVVGRDASQLDDMEQSLSDKDKN